MVSLRVRATTVAVVMSLVGTALPLGTGVPFQPDLVAAATLTDSFDDNAQNTSLWTSRVEGAGISHAERNQRLEVSVTAAASGGTFTAGYTGRCKLTGDFDMQVDYELLTWPPGNGIRVGLTAESYPSSARWMMERISFGNGDVRPKGEAYLVDAAGAVVGVTTTTDLAGKLRLTRAGSTYTGYRFSNGDWVIQHSGVGQSGAVPFSILAWSHDAFFIGQAVELAFDNFVLSSGELSCPLPPEQVYGDCQSGHANCPVHFESDPVNTALGSYVSSAIDFALPGRGVNFAFRRTYNSLDSSAGTLGPGWRHSYEAHVVPNADGSVVFVAEDGARLVFAPDGLGRFTSPSGGLSGLVQITGGYELTRPDQLRYRFDAEGRLTAMVDRNNNQLSFSYTASQLTQILDSVGRSISLSYDAGGRLSGVVGPPSRSVTYTYHADGRLASVTDVRGKVTTYTYEPGGRLATIVDANNHTVVTNEYGSDGRISAQTDARGKRGTFAWDAATQTSTYIDANGGRWVDVYADHVLQRTVDPLGNTTRFTYDADFNVLTVTDPRNFVTRFTYDAAGNVLTRTAPSPLSYVETWTYTSSNDIATYRDGRGNTTTYEYDAAGNLVKISAPLDSVTVLGRDPAGTGLLTSVTDPRGKVTTYAYDAEGNRDRVTTPVGSVTAMTYDSGGRLLTLVEPRGNVTGANPADYTTTFAYDAAGRLLTTTDPLGNVTDHRYDDAGNPLSVTDANRHTTRFAYDAANNLTTVTDARDGVTTYSYDDVGNLISRTDANTHVTTYAYDLANRLVTTTMPGNRTWTMTYDAAGNVATRRDANAKTSTYVHDALNRLASVSYADASTPGVTFAYDANSNRTNMTDGLGTETSTFDALDRLTNVTRDSDVFSYGYDAGGNITSRTYPNGAVHAWTYDDASRLTGANGATYTYDAAGNLLTAATADGVTARYAWDRAGRLVEVANTTTNATLSRFSYALDPVGNRIAMTTRDGTVTYRSDELGRLIEACWSQTNCPGGAPATPLPCLQCVGGLVSRPAASTAPPAGESYRTYSYDSVGNRLTEASDDRTTTYAYDVADRLTSVVVPNQGTTSYTYDANGNQLSAGATTFTYDLADRLKTASAGNTTETYTYAGDGTRLSAATGAQANKTIKFVWDRAFDLPQLALERNGNNTDLRSYGYGLDLLSQTTGNNVYWYHHDGLGSVVDVTDATGKSLSWSDYYPYGSLRAAGAERKAPSAQTFAFTGEQHDSFTGLYHLRARQYDPSTGRFLSVDPEPPSLSDPQISAYAYARSAPGTWVDPSGRCVQTLAAVFAGPPGVAAAGGGFLICVAAVALGAAAVSGTTAYVVENPPRIDMDLARPEFPEPFEPERHREVVDSIYQAGDLGPELRSQLSRYCEAHSAVCTGAKLAALIASLGIISSALHGDGDITEPPNHPK